MADTAREIKFRFHSRKKATITAAFCNQHVVSGVDGSFFTVPAA